MNSTELLMRRRNVHAFVDADSIDLVVNRPAPPTQSAAGGWLKSAPTSLPPQQARIVLNKRRYTNGLVNSEAGEIPHTDYLLIADHDKDFQVDDSFLYLGINYKITGIYTARVESILASIDLLGPDDHNGIE